MPRMYIEQKLMLYYLCEQRNVNILVGYYLLEIVPGLTTVTDGYALN